jgi:hypothetical protein
VLWGIELPHGKIGQKSIGSGQEALEPILELLSRFFWFLETVQPYFLPLKRR